MTINQNDFWQSTGCPPEPGWYSVLICYNADEGAFQYTAYWYGDRLNKSHVVAFGAAEKTGRPNGDGSENLRAKRIAMFAYNFQKKGYLRDECQYSDQDDIAAWNAGWDSASQEAE